MAFGTEQASGEIDVDALMADVEAGNETNVSDPAPAAAAAAAQPTAQEIQEMELTWNGKQIKAPVDRVKQWASQGYDYAQKMAEFKAKQDAFDRSQKEFEPLRARYADIDKYVQENPQWLDHVNQQYMAAIGKAQSEGAPDAKIQALEQELQDLKAFKEELTTERTTAKHQQEDQKLDGEIQSIQGKYPDLDWKTPNGDGKTMEAQVLEFATQNGIKSFEHAFKLFNHDSLITLHAARAKEETVKAKQAQTKSGLLGSTPAPTKAFERATNLKTKSYNDLTREALEELGLT
jgi:predicted RNase H-like nuclease (RuvC/YqgF family)